MFTFIDYYFLNFLKIDVRLLLCSLMTWHLVLTEAVGEDVGDVIGDDVVGEDDGEDGNGLPVVDPVGFEVVYFG